jgi:hypothetical protein
MGFSFHGLFLSNAPSSDDPAIPLSILRPRASCLYGLFSAED